MFTEGEKRGWRWKAEDRRGHSGLVSWKLDGIFRSWFSWSLDWSFPHFIHPFNLEISEPLLFSLVVYFRFIDSICRLLRINQTISTESRSVFFFSNTMIPCGTRDDGSDDYDRDLITHSHQAKLEQNLDELEDSVERERKVRGKKDGIFISVFYL